MNELTPTNPKEKIEHNLTLLAQKINNSYKEGISAYTETLSNYGLEIEALKNKIYTLHKAYKVEEEQLKFIEKERDHEARFLQKLDDAFTQKVLVIHELNTQYASLMERSEYTNVLKRKKNELQLFLDEIEEVEITLLQQELERINLLIILNPKRTKILQLQEDLKRLEREREYYSLTKLQQLPQLAIEPNQDEIPTEIIEKDEEEAKRET